MKHWIHFLALVLLFFSLVTVNVGAQETTSQIRTYYIAADLIDWNYAPGGDVLQMGRLSDIPEEDMDTMEDMLSEMESMADIFLENEENRIGSIYRKAIYQEYTDDTFTELKPRPAEWEHLGLLGPLIRAEVGDTIVIVFKNNADRPYSIHPHGVLYKKDSEGAGYNDGTEGDDQLDEAVSPGATHTYTWEVPERSGPGPNDPSSVAWLYHSHTHEVNDTNAGLVGVMIIYAEGVLGEDGKVDGIDREFVNLFKIFNENGSWYLAENIQTFAGNPSSVDPADPDFEESNLKHTINGYLYGTMPGVVIQEGETVRWYVAALGSEPDLHTPHWHGITGLWHGNRVDAISLLPGEATVIDMFADNPGTWLYHCHVDDHIAAGMATTFTVTPQ